MEVIPFLIPLLLTFAALPQGELRIYAIDVEGGKASLYISPLGETMLIDAGYAGHNGRDANRIVAAMKAAHVQRIDHLVVTHYHADHVGGVAELAALVPIGTIYDHGETWDKANIKTAALVEAYDVVRRKYPHKVLKPGDRIPIKGISVDVVAASGEVISKPMPGAGAKNPICSSYHALEPDPGENALSLGFIIQFGNFRVADLGDLFWNKEYLLACPINKLGSVDLYMTTHHGTKTSGHPQIVHALKPKVAIMNNGYSKGGSIAAWQTIHDSSGLQDLWQLHFSSEGGKTHNSPEKWIANVDEQCAGKGITVSAKATGAFTVHNDRNGFEKTYTKSQQ